MRNYMLTSGLYPEINLYCICTAVGMPVVTTEQQTDGAATVQLRTFLRSSQLASPIPSYGLTPVRPT